MNSAGKAEKYRYQKGRRRKRGRESIWFTKAGGGFGARSISKRCGLLKSDFSYDDNDYKRPDNLFT